MSPATARILGWMLGLLAGASLVLVGVNIYLASTNQRLQREVSERQQFINQSVRIQALAKDVVTALANHAARTNDDAVRQLLTSHGINIGAAPAPAAPGPATPEPRRR